ncbi:hypothetical protein D3C85_1219190 [compost metagenome]
MVFPEGHKSVRNGNAVNPQQRADGEEVEEGDDHAAGLTKMLFDRLGNITGWVAARQTQTCQRAVAIEGNRVCQKQHQQDRNQAAKTGADREEQHACTDCGTEQPQCPGGI